MHYLVIRKRPGWAQKVYRIEDEQAWGAVMQQYVVRYKTDMAVIKLYHKQAKGERWRYIAICDGELFDYSWLTASEACLVNIPPLTHERIYRANTLDQVIDYFNGLDTDRAQACARSLVKEI